jgi:hypothetical protein
MVCVREDVQVFMAAFFSELPEKVCVDLHVNEAT